MCSRPGNNKLSDRALQQISEGFDDPAPKASMPWFLLLVMGFAYITMNYSLFGIGDRVDRYLGDLFNTYAGKWVYHEPRHDITVLLLTDEAVDKHLNGHWPANYDFHGRVLNTLLKNEPKAVFIDFLWLSQRPSRAEEDKHIDGDYLMKVLQRYKVQGIPVYLASTPAVEKNWPELSGSGLVTHVDADLSFDVADFVSRTYATYSNGMPTAAFQIASDVHPDLFIRSPDRPMDVFWGTQENPYNKVWMTAASSSDTSLFTVATSGYSGVRTSIPYTTTLYVRDLLHPVAETPARVLEQTDAFIKDSVIMYGANLSGVNDFIFTPTRDILPGVYLHAMALDNLFHWGLNYKSDKGSGLLASKGWYDLWRLLVIFPVAFLFVFFHPNVRLRAPCRKLHTWRRSGRNLTARYPRVSKVILAALVGLWFGGWAVIEFYWLNMSVTAAAGYLQFMALGYFLHKLGMLDNMINNVLVPLKDRLDTSMRKRRTH